MEARKQFSRVGWAFAVFALISMAFQVILGVGIILWMRRPGGGVRQEDSG